ncbi:MAG: hypothetical protein AAF358_26165 [Pseudomonadota bacterium]
MKTYAISSSRRRPSRTRLLVRIAAVLALAVTSAASAALLMVRPQPSIDFAPGHTLQWHEPAELPAWAKTALEEHIEQSDYQIQVALAELNRDRQPEILVAAAARRYDVFIPHTPLRIIRLDQGTWKISESEFNCRPQRLGSFVTDGYWDLDCSHGSERRVLRWAGDRYTDARTRRHLRQS